ncbi:MAG: hypothetical protein LBM65_04995 [Oscillospiraceae bacterium]|jgi:hypothetical protein|nr:hypothetical protein [Oscillospiraceae bacterium]
MRNNKFFWLVSFIGLVAAATAALTAFFIIKDKKDRENLELEDYLENGIE